MSVLQATGQPQSGTARNRGINYFGNLGRMLRDLTGFATLTFELLQNADDAGATLLRFDVGEEALVVSALLLKLQVPDRTAAAARARDAGLGQAEPR